MYWPMAIVRDLNNTKNYPLYTYDGLFTIEEAKKVIEKWKESNDIDVLFEYIKDDNKNIVYYNMNIDYLVHAQYKRKRKNVYLNFENANYKEAALNTERVNYENEITAADAFIVLLKDVEYDTINNLCTEVAKIIQEEIQSQKINLYVYSNAVYDYINNEIDLTVFNKIVLDQAYKLIGKGEKLGTKTDGKRNASNWIIHCLIEGALMSKLADATGLDPDTAMKLGILHDVGRKKDHSFIHTVKGFEYLMDKGLTNEAFCTLTHSFLPSLKDGVNIGNRCATGDPPIDGFYVNEKGEGVFEKDAILDDVTYFLENYEYNSYDILLNIADLMATSEGIKSPYERIQNIYSKRTPDPRNSSFFKVCVINSLIRFISSIKEEEYTPINIRKINSTEEIDNLLLKVSDSFMDNYYNIIKESNIKKGKK